MSLLIVSIGLCYFIYKTISPEGLLWLVLGLGMLYGMLHSSISDAKGYSYRAPRVAHLRTHLRSHHKMNCSSYLDCAVKGK